MVTIFYAKPILFLYFKLQFIIIAVSGIHSQEQRQSTYILAHMSLYVNV